MSSVTDVTQATTSSSLTGSAVDETNPLVLILLLEAQCADSLFSMSQNVMSTSTHLLEEYNGEVDTITETEKELDTMSKNFSVDQEGDFVTLSNQLQQEITQAVNYQSLIGTDWTMNVAPLMQTIQTEIQVGGKELGVISQEEKVINNIN